MPKILQNDFNNKNMYILKIKHFYPGKIKIKYYGHLKHLRYLFTYPSYGYRNRGRNNKALNCLSGNRLY